MRAIVMAAGLGTRLRPLTDSLPKPLVPVGGRPMVEYVLANLARAGVREALINVHYLPEKMRAFVQDWNARGGIPRLTVQDESARILDSGGGVALAAPWLFAGGAQTALVANSDVLGTFDLPALAAAHARLAKRGVLCTLAVVEHPEAGAKFTGLRRSGDLVTAFERPGQHEPALWHFPGYYAISAEAIARLPAAGQVFSIVEELWKPLAREGKLGAWTHLGTYHDLGTVADLQAAEAMLAKERP